MSEKPTTEAGFVLTKLSPEYYTLFIKQEIPEHIVWEIENYLRRGGPEPALLRWLINWERSKLLPPVEISGLIGRFDRRFPGLLKELVERERKAKETETGK